MTAVRAFVALPLPAGAIEVCVRTQEELQSRGVRGRVRWTRPEQMHVTVKFLGDLAASDVGRACDVVRRAAFESCPFSCAMGSPDAFPTPRRARVVVAQLASVPTLEALFAELQGGFAPLAVHEEKRAFTPHVTLGRLRQPANIEAQLSGFESAAGAVRLDTLVLFRSELAPDGSRYTPLVRAPLGGSQPATAREPASEP